MKTAEDLIALFPHVYKNTAYQWSSPCPFCDRDVTSVQKGQAWFTGDDRLVWFLKDKNFWCRTCGNHRLTDVMSVLGVEVQTMVFPSVEDYVNPLRGLWSNADVEEAHAAVDRAFWYKFGWKDDTIDRFRLGYGTLYKTDGPGHIIPMTISSYGDNIERSWYVSCRIPGKPTKRNQGSSRGYWWVAQRTESDTWVFTEGEKDAITATILYPEYNVVAIFGAANTDSTQLFNVARLGAKHLIVLGDNDTPGSNFSRFYIDYAAMAKLDFSYIEWPSDLPTGYDITDAYSSSFDIDAHVVFIDWRSLSVSHDTFVPYITKRDDNPFFFGQEVALDALRDPNNPDSLFRRVNAFINGSGRSDVLVLAAPPGSGKTHALVQNVNRYAENSFKRTADQLGAMVNSLEDLKRRFADMTDKRDVDAAQRAIDRLESSIANFSHAKVAWLTLFKSGYDELLAVGLLPDLAYNFQARNEGNCENFDYATRLAAANHDVGKFCELGCPYKEACKVSGYLSQHDRVREKPVTVYRHNHVMMRAISKYDLLIVDENLSNVFDGEPLMVSASDLDPHDSNWDFNEPDVDAVQDIRLFVGVLKAYLSAFESDKAEAAGFDRSLHSDFYEVYAALDAILKQKHPDLSFRDLVVRLDEAVLTRSYQPTSLDQAVTLQPIRRVIHLVYKTLLSVFVGNYDISNIAYPITRVADKFCIYPTEMPTVRRDAKVIVADATGSPLVSEAVFKRASQVYAPTVFNPQTETIVVYGSDWSATGLNRDLGPVFAARDRLKKTAGLRITNVVGESFDIQDVEEGSEITDKRVVQEAMIIIRGLSTRHNSLLVVTRKKFADLLRDTVGGANVAYAHFNSLRGSNAFKDFAAVVILGAYRIPPLFLRQKIQYWAFLRGVKEPIPLEAVRKTIQYHRQVSGYTYWTYQNWFADQFVHQVEAGEMIQCAERIRPHTSQGQKKFVYCVANRPAMRAVTEVVRKSDFINDLLGRPTLMDMEDYLYSEGVRTYDSFGKMLFPSYKEVAAKYGVSNTTISATLRRVRERIEKERSQ